MLANFGKPKRNSAVQCDCERDGNASVLQVLSLANHPRVWAKIADDKGQVARIVEGDRRRQGSASRSCISLTLGRLPTDGGAAGVREVSEGIGIDRQGIARNPVELAEHARVCLQH